MSWTFKLIWFDTGPAICSATWLQEKACHCTFRYRPWCRENSRSIVEDIINGKRCSPRSRWSVISWWCIEYGHSWLASDTWILPFPKDRLSWLPQTSRYFPKIAKSWLDLIYVFLVLNARMTNDLQRLYCCTAGGRLGALATPLNFTSTNISTQTWVVVVDLSSHEHFFINRGMNPWGSTSSSNDFV